MVYVVGTHIDLSKLNRTGLVENAPEKLSRWTYVPGTKIVFVNIAGATA